MNQFTDAVQSNQQIQNNQESSSYNRRLLRSMIKNSPISSAMLIIIIIMFLVCLISDLKTKAYDIRRFSQQTLISYGANVNYLVNRGQVYRLVTAMFLHSGLIHLLLNSSSFFYSLMPVEKRTSSHLIFFTVLILGGIIGNILSDLVGNIRQVGSGGVGASTSICSVMGFDIAYKILRVNNQSFNKKNIIVNLLFLFLISLMPNVGFWGHFGSLFAGFFFGIAILKGNASYFGQAFVKIIKLIGIVLSLIYIGLLITLLKLTSDRI